MGKPGFVLGMKITIFEENDSMQIRTKKKKRRIVIKKWWQKLGEERGIIEVIVKKLQEEYRVGTNWRGKKGLVDLL